MNGTENLKILNDRIEIVGKDDNIGVNVMHVGEKKLMKKFAEIGTQNGGHILEIGFGMHLSADEVQSNPNVLSHTIIEVHPAQYERAIEWSKKQQKKTEIIFGNWIDVLPLKNKKFDGILHDTHLDPNIIKFLDYVEDNCKKDTIVVFYEYRKLDDRFNGVRFELSDEDYYSLPYQRSMPKIFELKYTTYDGKKFYRKKPTKKSLI